MSKYKQFFFSPYNLELFQKFIIYAWTDRQVVGNFIMLLPLGLYVPILYKQMNSLFKVLIIAFFFSLGIELIQLTFTYLASMSVTYYHRTFDVDDIFLNTTGAMLGFLLLRVIQWMLKEIKRYSNHK